MQIVQEKKHVISHGILEKRDFTIKAGAHIMSVLSGLYKNPIDAMVREYLTNMYDAALATGNASAVRAPILRVPGPLSPNLEFHDFGIGMSKETVLEVYSQYGNSTKNDSNAQVGGFGLGSKTAFCYNSGQAWMISSRFNGRKYTFIANVGEDGIPQLQMVGDAPTNEHNGVTVSVPIRREHFTDVHTAVRKYVPYFPTEVVVEGLVVNKINYTISGTDWGMLGIRDATGQPTTSQQGYGSARSGRRSVQIIMGNVPYELSTQFMKWPSDVPGCSTYHNVFIQNSTDIYLPIGSVDIVPSRDDIKYTDRTIHAISDAVRAISKELPTVISSRIAASKNEWDALTVAHAIIKDYNFDSSTVRNLNWNGIPLDPNVGISRTLNQLKKFDPSIEVSQYSITDSGRSTVEVNSNPDKLNLRFEHTFLVIDSGIRGGATITKSLVWHKLVNRSGSGRALRYGHKQGHAYLLTTKLDKAKLSEIFGGFLESEIRTTQEISGQISIPTALKVTKDTIYRFGASGRWEARVNVPQSTATKYYLPLEKSITGKFIYGSDKQATFDVQTLAGKHDVNVAQGDVIYGVKKNDTINLDSTWVNLYDEVVKLSIAYCEKFIERLAYVNRATINGNEHYVNQLFLDSKINKLDPKIESFTSEWSKYTTAKNDDLLISSYKFLCNQMKAGSLSKKVELIKTPNFGDRIDTIGKLYPMLKLAIDFGAASYYNNKTTPVRATAIWDYVTLVQTTI